MALQVMLEQFSKLEDLTITLNDISQEKIRLENENKRLNSELENLKQTSSGQSRRVIIKNTTLSTKNHINLVSATKIFLTVYN